MTSHKYKISIMKSAGDMYWMLDFLRRLVDVEPEARNCRSCGHSPTSHVAKMKQNMNHFEEFSYEMRRRECKKCKCTQFKWNPHWLRIKHQKHPPKTSIKGIITGIKMRNKHRDYVSWFKQSLFYWTEKSMSWTSVGSLTNREWKRLQLEFKPFVIKTANMN